MAKISISNRYIPEILNTLVNTEWLVNVDFETEDIFVSYIRAGLVPSDWESKNKNKILISGIPYKDYLNNKNK